MVEVPIWAKAVASVGAAAALALVLRRLQQQRQGEVAAPAPRATPEVKPAAAAAEPAPAEPAAAANGHSHATGATGIEAQRAAALAGGAAERPWAPDFDAPLEVDVERRLRARYNPTYLDIENQGNSCGALKLAVVMVSEVFKGQTRINRQREVQSLLKPDLDTGRLHALSLMLKTPEEHAKLMEKQGAQ
eukprot:CAMPEP_0204585978 /NCGR_PEP_ID=MMETSP0661-20131031/47228_1 /ASSEMBLY_ACC=CAM_ASM_000606 /TAXON_ID=109239 /ORGANISM="Alexandrium margalefi, Strain AMGDE01CS-322" /LENGTH=189 /DNA_ID=CAMNT_0051595579 /DNA_START=64 /DNA_END=633 /DNA_ORIENTATION=+